LDLFGCEFLAHLGTLFEYWILGDLRVDHVLQFQPIELEDRDHLHQTRCEDLFLGYP
jgi:hypothetical protein